MSAKQEKMNHPGAFRRSRIRIRIFRLLALLIIPLVFFVGLELGLRFCGVGYPTAAIVKRTVDGKTLYCHNHQFGWRFFPKNISRQLEGFSFEVPKPTRTCRIFVLGASAAMGMPEPAYNFGRILEVMLNEACPETRFEVITVAMVAINSHVVVEIAKDCAEYEPDLFIVYLGNNEVVGPFGPGAVFSPMSPGRFAIRANITLKSTRIGQLTDQIFQSIIPKDQPPKRWGGLGMFLEKQVRYDSPLLEPVYRHFEKNLSDICGIAHRSGARVILSTVGCNVKDSPPFASLHKESLSKTEQQTWEEIYQQGIEHENAGRFSKAVQSYLTAAVIDDAFADLQFRLGRCYWQQEEYENARLHYQKALHCDTLRFRANDRINAVIRSVADRQNKNYVFLVDSVAALEENSPHGIPGEELFYEHAHLTFHGNYILARTMFSRIPEILPAAVTRKQPGVVSEQRCAQYLAYTGFERHYILNQFYQEMFPDPPFTNQLYHDRFMEKTEREVLKWSTYLTPSHLEESRSVYEYAIDRNPEDWKLRWRYAVLLGMRVKDLEEEEIQLRTVLRYCPYESAYLSLGTCLRRQKKLSEARQVLLELLEMKPNSLGAYTELARISQILGDNPTLIRYLSRIISIAPVHSIDPYGLLAQAYASTGRINKAIQTLRDAVKIFPEEKTAQAHALLGYLLFAKQEYEEASRQLHLALKIDPDLAIDNTFQKIRNALDAKLKQ